MPECDTVHYIVRFIVNQFQLDMLLVAPHHFARSIIVDVMRTEDRFQIIRAERIELLQVIEELGRNIPEIDLGINVNNGTRLLRQDML